MTSAEHAIRTSVASLPPLHLAGLRAALAGFDDEALARLLGVPVEAVGPTLGVAASKLAAALSRSA
jgi:hypothetical protein